MHQKQYPSPLPNRRSRVSKMTKKRLQKNFSRASKKSKMSDDLRWDLSQIYPGLDSVELKNDQKLTADLAKEFREKYEDRIISLTSEEFVQAIIFYEQIKAKQEKIEHYAYLLKAFDIKYFSKIKSLDKWGHNIDDDIDFFQSEIVELSEKDLLEKLSNPISSRYASWVSSVRAGGRDTKTDDVEAVQDGYNRINDSAWGRLYGEMLAHMKVGWKGRKISLTEAESIYFSSEKKSKEEKDMAAAIGKTLEEHSSYAALIYNAIVGENVIDDEFYGRDRPDAKNIEENRLDPEVVDLSSESIRSSHASLAQRFYKWKEKRTDLGVTPHWHFEEAQALVLRGFAKFSPRFSRLAQQFFENGHIDVMPRAGKESVSFTMNVDRDILPYVLLNFDGDAESVIALAHEMGHALHNRWAGKKQGVLLADMPTATNEIASLFAEAIVFEEMVRLEKDPAVLRRVRFEKVQEMLHMGLLQLAWHDFERQVHIERKNGPLDVERISDLWEATNEQFYGPSSEKILSERYDWIKVGHFFDTPFYNYSYAFAQLVAIGLYRLYKEAEAKGENAREAFVDKYIAFLEAGNTKSPQDLLAPFGIDLKDPAFWEKGLQFIEQQMNELIDEQAPASLASPQKKTQKIPKVKK